MSWFDIPLRVLALGTLAGLLMAVAKWRGRPLSAAFEHALWVCVMAGMLCMWLPKITIRAGEPAMAVPVLHSRDGRVASIVVHPNDKPGVFVPVAVQVSRVNRVWLIGSVLMLLRLALGFVFLRRRLEGARSILGEPAIREAIRGQESLIGGVEESADVGAPVTVGWPYARVVLPEAWRTWSEEKTAIVMAHEFAHIRRRDSLVALAAAVNKAVFWFHPVAWWIEHRLSELAEFAADERAIAAAREPGTYAEVLVEIAAENQKLRFPLFAVATGFAQRGFVRMDRRVSRILASRPRFGSLRAVPVFAGVVVAIVLVQVQRPLHGQVPAGAFQVRENISAGDAAELEKQLAANPENEQARLELSVYYERTEQNSKRLALVNWLIDHHPESKLFGFGNLSPTPRRDGLEAYEAAAAKWQAAAKAMPNNASVLLNAARGVGDTDFAAEVQLLKQGEPLDREKFTDLLARLYVQHSWWPSVSGVGATPATIAFIQADLASSQDALLLGKTGVQLVQYAAGRALKPEPEDNLAGMQSAAMDLLQRAAALDPGNQDWPNALSGARQLTSSAGATSVATPSTPMVVRVVAEL